MPFPKETDTLQEAEQEVLMVTLPDTEAQVIVHCMYYPGYYESKIRIWQSTYLLDRHSGHRSPLLHAEHIAVYPNWTDVPVGQPYRFTLVFAGLPKSCVLFDLIEDIPHMGGFEVLYIRRNSSDIYQVEV